MHTEFWLKNLLENVHWQDSKELNNEISKDFRDVCCGDGR
jgi:hypothetical protein